MVVTVKRGQLREQSRSAIDKPTGEAGKAVEKDKDSKKKD